MPSSPSTLQTAAANLPSADFSVNAASDVPPHIQIIQTAVAIWTARAVYAAAHFGLADLLADGPHTFEELARATGTHAPALYRLLRALASRGILTEMDRGHFALTALGGALRTDAPGAARAVVLTLGGAWQWKAWDNVLHSLQTGKSGLSAAYGMDLFEYLAAHPLDAAMFDEAMVGMHGAVGSAIVAAYDFSRFKTVVDLGGGTGALLRTILQSNEGLRGIVFELGTTVPQAQRLIEASGLSPRCKVVEGDFFTSVPAPHDAYILAHVLHDWSDDQALRILRNCREAITEGGRLLIVESVLPEGDAPHHGKLMDLLMLTVTGGMERTAGEFGALLTAAGFKLQATIPTSTHQSILEAVPV